VNHDTIKGEIKQLRGKLRAKWGKLTDNDVELIAGKKDILVGKIQERYGHSKDDAEKQVDAFYDELDREEKEEQRVESDSRHAAR
jgi:uncharacterized protein YjbJ (UPF0337 family)